MDRIGTHNIVCEALDCKMNDDALCIFPFKHELHLSIKPDKTFVCNEYEEEEEEEDGSV